MKVSKRLAIMAAAVGAGVGFGSQARAATYYWDVDAGAGFGTGSGTVSWLTNNWTTDATGAAAVGAWAQGNDAVFDAGSGAYTVAPSTATPIVANGLYFQQGTVSLILATASDNPGLHLRNGIAVPTVSVASGAVGLINTYKVVAPIGFNKTGDGLLSFGGSSTVGNLDVRGAIGVKEGTRAAERSAANPAPTERTGSA